MGMRYEELPKFSGGKAPAGLLFIPLASGVLCATVAQLIPVSAEHFFTFLPAEVFFLLNSFFPSGVPDKLNFS